MARFEVVLLKCSKETNFRPLDMFGVSHAAALGGLGVFVSYVLFLLQFKVIESRNMSMG